MRLCAVCLEEWPADCICPDDEPEDAAAENDAA
jgi:hypothetical protein